MTLGLLPFLTVSISLPDWVLGDLRGSQEHHHYVDVDRVDVIGGELPVDHLFGVLG